MTKTVLRGAITLLICLGLPTGYAFAENHDRGKEQHERVERERAHQRAEVRHEQRREWRDHERQREIAREHTANRQPPGWNHGTKEGWKKCDVPPGQAKTNGCDMKVYYARHPEWRPAATKTPQRNPAQREAWQHEQEKRHAEWLKQHPLPANAPPQPAR